jgi:CubicO group peptidase (beta-lactamase class C family)
MSKYLVLISFSFLFIFSSLAEHQNQPYEPHDWDKFKVVGSENYYKFGTELIEDKDVKKEIKNTKKTGLISYLLFEDDKIKIDEESLPYYIRSNNGIMPSHSVGKSLVSYVLGHAICEGYIDSIEVTLDDWSVLDGTLYKGQKLIDILNMSAGDQKIIGERNFNSDNGIQDKTGKRKLNVNTFPIEEVMKLKTLQNSKKSKAVYNYNALATNLLMNYTIFKTGDDWEKLLHKVFNENVKVKDTVWFHKTVKTNYEKCKSFDKGDMNWYSNNCDVKPGKEVGRYSFYAKRYDYLRIGKRILDDWNNDTCVGKYIKIIYEQRINKNRKGYNTQSASQYSKKYGGQFHFDIKGLTKKSILAMDGFGGQQVIVDFDTGRIIVVHSLDRHYNWKKIVYKKLKQK